MHFCLWFSKSLKVFYIEDKGENIYVVLISKYLLDSTFLLLSYIQRLIEPFYIKVLLEMIFFF